MATGSVIRNLIVKVGADLTEFNKKMKDITKDINKVGKTFKDVGSGLTKGLTLPIVGAVAGLTGLAIKAGSTADELITLSNKTGLTTEALQEMQYAARFVDVEVETMTSSMQKLTKNMDLARDGSKKQAEAFETLGVKYKNADGTLRNAKDVWADTIDALGKISSEADRDALAMELFGKSAAELNPIIKAGSDELKRLQQEAHEVGAVMSNENVEALGKFDDSMEKLKAVLSNTAGQVAASFLPVIESLKPILENNIIPAIKKFAEFLGKVFNWFSELSPKTQKFILAAVALAAALGPLLSLVGNMITTIGTFTKIIGLVASPVGLVVAAVLALAAVAYVVIKNWDKIATFFANFWDGVKDTFYKALNWFKRLPDMMLDIGKNIVEGLWTGIKNAAKWLKDKIKGFADGVVGSIKNFFGIGSPSKLMAEEVGKWIPKGISVGINANVGSIEEAIKAINTDLTADFKSSKMLGSLPNNNLAYATTQPNINITIDNPYILDDYGVERLIDRMVSRLKLRGLNPK